MSDRSDLYRDFETKKSLHINLTRETHGSLRMICFQNRLSMQEVFEELGPGSTGTFMPIIQEVGLEPFAFQPFAFQLSGTADSLRFLSGSFF